MTQIHFKRPLLPLSVATVALECDERAALAAVQDGTVAFAFDIRSRRAGRQCIRVLAASLAAAQAARSGRVNGAGDAAGLEAAIKDIVPFAYDPPATVVARQLNCSPAHVHNLLAEGSLEKSRDGSTRLGSDSSPRVCRGSLVAFLRQRRVS
jgi:hypothetical protein